jgi:protein-disulfide isomerase
MINRLSNEAKVLSGIIIVTVIMLIGAVFFLSRPEKPVVVDAATLVKEDSLKTSTASAKLTIVEFGDLQCPACKMAHPGLKQAIAEAGPDVNFVFRHYPLPQHKNAMNGAKAVEAANLQGKVWQMFDKLYDAQEEWAESDNAVEIFKKYATELGMDADKLAKDMSDRAIEDKIIKDQGDGNASGVNSTPTLFFNNELYKKGVGYSDLKPEIEARLK